MQPCARKKQCHSAPRAREPAWRCVWRSAARGNVPRTTVYDIVVIKNWQRARRGTTHQRQAHAWLVTGPVITFLMIEHKLTNDFYLREGCNKKRSIYVELVLALLEAGWAVELNEQVIE